MNQITVSTTIPGKAGYFHIQLLQNGAAVGTPIPVVETEPILAPGVYCGTMSGTAGFYKAILAFENPPDPIYSYAEIDTFYWDGTNIVEVIPASEIWNFATRALTDKSDFSISSASVTSISNAVISAINTSLDLPAGELSAIAEAVRTNLATELSRIDVATSTRLASGNVTVGGYALGQSPAEQVETITALDIWEYPTRTLTSGSSGLTAADVWSYSGRSLDGIQAANLAYIASIPSNPLLEEDSRLDRLDANVSSRLASGNVTVGNYAVGQSPAEQIDLSNLPTEIWSYLGRSLDGSQGSIIDSIPTSFSNLISYGDSNWSSNDLTSIESNIGLLLDKNMLTIGKSVTHSPTSIVIGSNEVLINLVVDENNNTVTGTRSV